MLVLTRRISESVVIGKDRMVTVRVINVQGSQVKLGIEAPKHIPVHREEVYELIQKQNEEEEEEDEEDS